MSESKSRVRKHGHLTTGLDENAQGVVDRLARGKASRLPATNGDDLNPTAIEVPGKRGRKLEKPTREVKILVPRFEEIVVTITGDSPYISHAWSSKAKQKIEAEQTRDKSKSKLKKDLPPRVPEEEYRDAMLLCDDGKTPGIRALAVKCAMINACKFVDGVPSTLAKAAITVLGDVIPMKASAPVMRTDMVNIGAWNNKVTSPRYRPEYATWKATVHIRYWADKLTAEHVLNLLNIAGFTTGLGEWRQEKGGNFGAFHVEQVPTKK